MSLRDRLARGVEKLKNRLSGEYSAAEGEIRPAAPDTPAAPSGADVKVTRARLRRPGDEHKDA